MKLAPLIIGLSLLLWEQEARCDAGVPVAILLSPGLESLESAEVLEQAERRMMEETKQLEEEERAKTMVFFQAIADGQTRVVCLMLNAGFDICVRHSLLCGVHLGKLQNLKIERTACGGKDHGSRRVPPWVWRRRRAAATPRGLPQACAGCSRPTLTCRLPTTAPCGLPSAVFLRSSHSSGCWGVFAAKPPSVARLQLSELRPFARILSGFV